MAEPPEAPEPREDAELGRIAADLAQRGAAEVRRLVGDGRGLAPLDRKSSPTDPVTEADRRSHATICAELARLRPDDGLLSEEAPERPGSTGLRWVIDPLDGSVNLTYAIPHVCVSVACEVATPAGWRPVAAAVRDVFRDEAFTAVRGRGAYHGSRRLRVTDPVPPATALVAMEFAYLAASRRRQAELTRALLPQVGDLRSTGSSALDLCWVACGRLDGFVEDELGRWDWAAGALVVAEAGGVVSAYGTGVVAAGPGLHGWLAEQAYRNTPD